MTHTEARSLAATLAAQSKKTGRGTKATIGEEPRGVYFVRYGSRITYEDLHMHHPFLTVSGRMRLLARLDRCK
jgi:hypothetical protein